MKKSPLQIVKDRFGGKEALVKQLQSLFDKEELFLLRVNAEKELKSVSNRNLLKLLQLGTRIKEKFGSRKKLIDTILEFLKRTKDEGFRARLERFPLPRLWDLYRVTAPKGSIEKDSAPVAASPSAPKEAETAPKKKAPKAAPKKAAPKAAPKKTPAKSTPKKTPAKKK